MGVCRRRFIVDCVEGRWEYIFFPLRAVSWFEPL